MTYSCVDFTDSILNALGIVVPLESQDCPEDQANLAVTEIRRLQTATKLPTMDRMLYYVSPVSDQLEWDEDGPVDKSLFVYAKDASEAIKLWREYYELDDEESSLGSEVKVRVHEVPIMPPMAEPTAIGWSDVHTFGATVTKRDQI
jgi:hypothetical protein